MVAIKIAKPIPKFMQRKTTTDLSNKYPIAPKNIITPFDKNAYLITFSILVFPRANPAKADDNPKKTVHPSILFQAQFHMRRLFETRISQTVHLNASISYPPGIIKANILIESKYIIT